MFKKTAAILLGTAMAMSLVVVPASAEEEVTIKVFSNLPDRTNGQGYIEQMLFDQYMEEHPNVTIETEELDDESYKTKFKAYASGSSMPDLVNAWGQPSFLSEVIDAGLLAELNPDDYADYNFIEGSLAGFSKDGKLYGLARNTDVMGFYYNKALFEQVGAEVPTTWDELLDVVAKFNDEGIIPIAMDGSDKWPLDIMIEDIYVKLVGAGAYDNAVEAVATGEYDDNWKAAADKLVELAEAGGFQAGFETSDYGTTKNLFTNAQAAMYYMGSWEMSMATDENIPEDIRENISVFMMPALDGGEGTVTDIAAWNGGGYAVPENAENKEAAIDLLNYMFEPENWSKLCWENGVCMSAQNFADYLTGDETALQLAWVDIVDNSTSLSGVVLNDLGTSSFKTVSEDAAGELAIGSITTDEFFEKLAAEK